MQENISVKPPFFDAGKKYSLMMNCQYACCINYKSPGFCSVT